MNFRVTGKQVGNGIGTLSPSIGSPLVFDAVEKLAGRGIRGGSSMWIGNRGGGSPRIGRPPPFIGSWKGRAIVIKGAIKAAPYVAKTAFNTARDVSSHFMRDPKLKQKPINYALKKGRSLIDEAGKAVINKLADVVSTEGFRKGEYMWKTGTEHLNCFTLLWNFEL